MQKNKLISAIKNTNPAQRNFDHSKFMPQEDIDIILDACRWAPTKQNETHYRIYWTTNRNKIQEIHDQSKFFSVFDENTPIDHHGDTPDKYCVTNSQINANMVIAICEYWEQSSARGRTHMVVDDENFKYSATAYITKNKQIYISIGIAIGEIILAANALGYRTGLCSAWRENVMSEFTEGYEPQCLIGIGYPADRDRREHPDVYNKDILVRSRRNGPDDANWKFPHFSKKSIIKEI